MDLDRGMLARLDRRLLAELGRDERFQMVRVPIMSWPPCSATPVKMRCRCLRRRHSDS
jgi:hypothetical protein